MRLHDIERQRLAEREEWMASTRGKDLPSTSYDMSLRRWVASKPPPATTPEPEVALPPETLERIAFLARRGVTQREIAEVLRLSPSMVQRRLRAMLAEGVL